jgi:hypothetical protein
VWRGTKNGEDHRVQELLRQLDPDHPFVFASGGRHQPVNQLDAVMRGICSTLRANAKVTPRDLRRTHGTKITGLSFGRDAMNRVQNQKECCRLIVMAHERGYPQPVKRRTFWLSIVPRRICYFLVR